MMEDPKTAEVVQKGLQDEMNSAYQYIALASKHGTIAEKKEFLRYASDELQHARKLLDLLDEKQIELGEIPLHIPEMEDLYFYLIEYMAKEESAVFYYKALGELLKNPEMKQMCDAIQIEEQRHMQQMREMYQYVKEGRRHG